MPTIADINTRFALPIVCPTTGEHVSAETLYNRCCDALGYVVRDNIGDLIFDNFDYSADDAVCGTDASNEALHDAVYAWAKRVREQIASCDTLVHVMPRADSCDHNFDGRLDHIREDGSISGGEQVCTKCGMGAMHHSLIMGA